MKYVMKSKDGIFYEKRRVMDSVSLNEHEIEVDRTVYLSVKLPCRFVDGEYISVNEMPLIEYETDTSSPTESEPTADELLDILLG